MIKLNSVNKVFHYKGNAVHALRNVDLHVQAGEIYGVVGESGAGKSTLIRCANLLETPTSGEIIVAGKNLTQQSKLELLKSRHNIGMIFQHFNLLSNRNVYQNIALPLELIGLSREEMDARIKPLLSLTGLEDKAEHYPSQLSGGQKQRVAIARALASKPKVLLSDEATSALDPETTDSILQLLKEINEKLGLTILLITHEMNVVKKICDKVALIQNGELIENSEVGQFFTNPHSELGKRFVEQSHQFELPYDLVDRLRPEYSEQTPFPLIKLTFNGERVKEAVISELTRRFDLNVNILQAKVERIKDTTLGLMVAELDGENEQNKKAVDYLSTLSLKVEVLGYV